MSSDEEYIMRGVDWRKKGKMRQKKTKIIVADLQKI
jgi:hypothetical protein